MPLVLHKIVKGNCNSWEDVSEETFVSMVDIVGSQWVSIDEKTINKEKGWCLTFDDGNVSDFETVYPVLKERGVNATFFLITDKIGRKGYLTWAQIQEMSANGMRFGSHSVSHQKMTALTVKDAIYQFTKSKEILEHKLGNKILSFSYPFGENSEELNRICFQSGYKFVYTSRHGYVSNNFQTIPRNSVNSGMNIINIMSLLEPTMMTRCKWVVEDNTKKYFKSFLGHKNYIKIRNQIFQRNTEHFSFSKKNKF